MNSIAGHLNLKSQKMKKTKFIKISKGVDNVITGKFKLKFELSTPMNSRTKKKILIKIDILNKILLSFIKHKLFLTYLKEKIFFFF